MLLISGVLSTVDLQEAKSVLASAAFKDGRETAGWHAALVKNNEQADAEAPDVRALQLRFETSASIHSMTGAREAVGSDRRYSGNSQR